MERNAAGESQQEPRTEADARRARLAAELRANLKRRKAQAKARHAAGGRAKDKDPAGSST